MPPIYNRTNTQHHGNTDLEALFCDGEAGRDFNCLTYLVGASVTELLKDLCVGDNVLPKRNSFIATAIRFAPLVPGTDGGNTAAAPAASATLRDPGPCLDPGLLHERVVVEPDSGLICLARLLCTELSTYESALATGLNETVRVQPPRVVVFFPGESEAKAAIDPMRDALWGVHRLCVLLPDTGQTVDSERETPIDRWMGWNVKPMDDGSAAIAQRG